MNRREFTRVALGAAIAPWVLRPRAWEEQPAHRQGHPVFLPEVRARQAERLRAELRAFISMEESKLLALIPTQTGFIAVDCPNCNQGAQGGQLQWNIEEPSVLTCRYCGERYPSTKYREDRVLQVKDPLGQVQQYRYYQDASRRRYFFEARLWRLARDYFMLAAYDLAQVYYFTGEKLLARKVGLILDRFAELYPGFLVTRESSQDDQGFQDSPPYQTQGGKWGRWYFDEMPTPLIRAYDLVFESGELEKLGQERGLAVKRRIEEDFFRAAVRHVRTYPEFYANPSPRIYEGLAVLGRVIGEPDYVHDAVRRMKGLFEQSFMFDGMWKEGSFGYHDMTLRGMEPALDAVKDYSDPPGYLDPLDGARFDHLDVRQQIPMLARALQVTERFRYPDGRPLPVHDSWSRLRGAYLKGKPLSSSFPTFWPAVGHVYLGRGKGPDQTQVHLHFGGGYGHAHNDSLNLALFALGEELLPDLGYSHTRYRYWTRSTLGHNTVVVDGQEQHTGSEENPSDGNLLLFHAAGDAFQVAEASGERAYPGRVRAYRRAVLMVGIDDKHAYVVDLFRVAGGQRHEWVLHGSADRDQNLKVEAALSPCGEMLLPPGVTFAPPATEYETGTAAGQDPAYGFVRDVRRGSSPAVLVATFLPREEKGPSLRLHSLPPPGSEVFTGRAPSVRRADENDSRLDQFWMPVLLLRKEGRNLSETFVSVLEPFGARPFIKQVEKLDVVGGGEALRISASDWTDYLVYRDQDQEQGEAVCGRLHLKGRIGWVRERAGRALAMGLVAGTELSFGSRKLTSSGTLAGRVIGVLRKAAGSGMDALLVDGPFPSGADLAGLTVIVRHGDGSTHGYPVAGLRQEGGRRLLVLDMEPGFAIDRVGKTRFLFFPKREMEGDVTYSLANVAFSRA